MQAMLPVLLRAQRLPGSLSLWQQAAASAPTVGDHAIPAALQAALSYPRSELHIGASGAADGAPSCSTSHSGAWQGWQRGARGLKGYAYEDEGQAQQVGQHS